MGRKIKKRDILSACGLTLSLLSVFIFEQSTTPSSDPAVPLAPIMTDKSLGTIQTKDEVTSSIKKTYDPAPVPAPAAPSTVTTSFREIAPSNEPKEFSVDNVSYPLRTYKPFIIPNDPAANQWWVSQTKLASAWDVPRGANPTLIAVIDTGFGLRHEDLVDRWYSNNGESGPSTSEGTSVYNCTDRGIALDASCNLVDDNVDGIVDNETGVVSYENPSQLTCTVQLKPITKDCNRLDDDNNGYIDDVRGWDFVNQDNSTQAGQLSPNGSGTTHGTMVAGVAAATGNNSKGIAGVDWGATILPLQAIDDNSYGDTRSVGRAIYYAAMMGADVINLSLGSSLPDPYVQTAVQAAIAKGAIVVAASGNDGCDCLSYPANYPEVLAVGALAENLTRASFSSWGNNLDMLAPGTNITTPTWSSTNTTSLYASGVAGTSFSTPMISGMISRLLSNVPSATPLQLRALITENTNRLSLGSATRNTTYGFGTLDAEKPTLRTFTPYNPDILYAFTPISSGDRLTPAAPKEPLASSSGALYKCRDLAFGSTPVYELVGSSSRFFSASEAEVDAARKNGFTASLFAYSCMQLPGDTPFVIRNIDIFSEFRNIFNKY